MLTMHWTFESNRDWGEEEQYPRVFSGQGDKPGSHVARGSNSHGRLQVRSEANRGLWDFAGSLIS